MTIRLARVDDADALARVHVEGWRWGYRGLLPDAFLDGLSVPDRAARWRDILARDAPRERTWVALDDHDAQGFVSIGPGRGVPDDVAELYAMYVTSRAAGTGVARVLMEHAIDALRADSRRAILWVLEHNARARRFYEREGWRADGETKRDTIGGREVLELRYAIVF
ncbi:GNAT family N-acetyltransferase [Sandaracinus amylolyticus]|uniref:GCN5-related N-acetyltransferase n=1 Tax=Sandaracinus amylolyticus TaxID=927083 RepID=A0A0F6YNG1_9BACT|nr:GNAT family N-acetyltransferase [Sandaracinus amylolyticus]AKF11416.1 GCN5-related N-acetyltransferase [Sandaracinus amylolyticus]